MSFIGTKEITVTIAINTSLSAAVELKGADVIRIAMPGKAVLDCVQFTTRSNQMRKCFI